MGAWSHTSFGNFDAADFLTEVEEDGEAAVANAFEVVNFLKPDDWLEAPDAAVAIAAAELVAAAALKPAPDLPAEATAVVAKVRSHSELKPEAVKALKRVLDYSELKEQWLETKDFAAWKGSVENLIERLS